MKYYWCTVNKVFKHEIDDTLQEFYKEFYNMPNPSQIKSLMVRKGKKLLPSHKAYITSLYKSSYSTGILRNFKMLGNYKSKIVEVKKIAHLIRMGYIRKDESPYQGAFGGWVKISITPAGRRAAKRILNQL